MAEVICEAKGVSHEFKLPNGQPLKVLENIDLTIRGREILALLGPSGCGKSTILRILAGLIRPTAGEVLVHGQPLTGINASVGIVFQSFALFPWLTVEENIAVVLEAAGVGEAERRARAQRAIQKVGLEGFDHAYPRELSGGMKQRVGMARALAVQPEMLFMDEPFSHVDALTGEALRAEVVDIWSAASPGTGLSSVLMVSHDIREVVFMADRVVVLAAHPGRVRTVLDIKLPRPRDYRAPEFQALVDQLHDLIVGAELPDPTIASMHEETAVPEPLPEASASDVVGLLEYLDARKGREDVFRIAADTHQPFGHIIAVVKAAEMMDVVDTPKRQVVLTADGRRMLSATTTDRRRLWRDKLRGLVLFREVEDLLEKAGEDGVVPDDVTAIVQKLLPDEDYRRQFHTLVDWGRYGHAIRYEDDGERIRIERRAADR